MGPLVVSSVALYWRAPSICIGGGLDHCLWAIAGPPSPPRGPTPLGDVEGMVPGLAAAPRGGQTVPAQAATGSLRCDRGFSAPDGTRHTECEPVAHTRY